MAKILHIFGARPQFMQAAMLNKEFIERGHENILLHTGQHYDPIMSEIFRKQLEMPKIDICLNVGSSTHGVQTGKILSELDNVIIENEFDAIVVDGDTNSTLAGALAAVKLHIPLVHIEAGLRSYDKKMPEEINRIVTDHVSDLLCAPTENTLRNLTLENLQRRSIVTGDLMFDCFLAYKAKANFDILTQLKIKPKAFCLVTIHRVDNTSNIDPIIEILETINGLPLKTVFPVHPRTIALLAKTGIDYQNIYKNIIFIEPIGYLEMIALELAAETIFTDSGGVQREAYFARVPALILRHSTEWIENVEMGWSVLVGTKKEAILNAYQNIHAQVKKEFPVYGAGQAACKIVTAIEERLLCAA